MKKGKKETRSTTLRNIDPKRWAQFTGLCSLEGKGTNEKILELVDEFTKKNLHKLQNGKED